MSEDFGGNPFAAAGSDFRRQQEQRATSAMSAARAAPPPKPTPTARQATSPSAAVTPPIPPPSSGAQYPVQQPNAAAAFRTPPSSGGQLPAQQPTAAAAFKPTQLADTGRPPWQEDKDITACACCCRRFDSFLRKHHCRGCGGIFCNQCTPPPLMMMPEAWGMREPQRACMACAAQLSSMQGQLVRTNSNAVRDNLIDTDGVRRYFNRPVAFTLGGEVRKAAHSINNMMSGIEAMANDGSLQSEYMRGAKGLLFMTVGKVAFGAGLRIGTGLLIVRLPGKPGLQPQQQQSRLGSRPGGGGGGGAASATAAAPRQYQVPVQPWGGDGGRWSAPCAVGLMGLSAGLEAGLETVDLVLPVHDEGVLEKFCSGKRHLTLGGEASLSFGIVGRSFNKQNLSSSSAPGKGTSAKAYSHSRGLYGGVAIQGGMVSVRRDVNTAFYGCECEPIDLFRGVVPPPPNANVLYDILDSYETWAGLNHALQPPPAFDLVDNTFHNVGEGEASV